MKAFFFLNGLICLALVTSCRTNRVVDDEVVCETVHQYGVPLEPKDWASRGENGQVISMRKDGVRLSRTYSQGILHGDSSYTFPHREIIQKKESYNQGVLTQECFYYPSGLPQRQLVHESPDKSLSTVWYESGAPHAREEIVNGNLVKGEYYNFDNQIESQVNEANGLRISRNGQGDLQSIDTISAGYMVLSTTLHPDGTPATVTPYNQGMIEGDRRTYHPRGEPATIEKWKNNVQHGTTIVFECGEKRAEVPYINGDKHGIERRYRDENTVAQEISWVRGEQHGLTTNYFGNETKADWYFRGRLVPNKATFDMLMNQ